MKSTIATSLLLLIVTAMSCAQDTKTEAMSGTVYDFTMTDIDGKAQALSAYKGQVLLVVNTASECGYTPQYAALEKLYQTYRDEGFHILAFPSNNFGAQEPGTDAEIKEFCSVNYDVSFPLFSKIAVKGNDQHPFYTYLTGFPDVSGEIEWNFNKFLIGRSGKPVARFGTRTDPLDEAVIAKIELILRQ